MKDGTLKNILDAVRDWVKLQMEPGEIYEVAPNEIVKLLFYGDVNFDELVPVSGAKEFYPVDSITNYLHFLEIFYGKEETNTSN